MNPNAFAKKVAALAKAWRDEDEVNIEGMFSIADRKALGKRFPLGAALLQRLMEAFADLAAAEGEVTFHLDLLCVTAGVPLPDTKEMAEAMAVLAAGAEELTGDDVDGDADAASVIDDKALHDALGGGPPKGDK
jgi:hypothetical protein